MVQTTEMDDQMECDYFARLGESDQRLLRTAWACVTQDRHQMRLYDFLGRLAVLCPDVIDTDRLGRLRPVADHLDTRHGVFPRRMGGR